MTMISQNYSEFALHARAILGLPIPVIRQYGPAASAVLLVPGHSQQISYGNLVQALQQPDTDLRLFGKPEVQGDNVEQAKQKALDVIAQIRVDVL